jgi:hypothetical protein
MTTSFLDYPILIVIAVVAFLLIISGIISVLGFPWLKIIHFPLRKKGKSKLSQRARRAKELTRGGALIMSGGLLLVFVLIGYTAGMP